MTSLFDWLGEIVRAIFNIIPRFMIVKTTHAGVAWIRGSKIKEIKPGFRFWWPLWTDYMLYPTVRQTMNLPQQTLTTKDGIEVQVNIIVVYRISDIVDALTKQYDLEETIRDLCLASSKEIIMGSTYDEILSTYTFVDQKLTNEALENLDEFGVDVWRVRITDFARTKVYTISGMGQKSIIPGEVIE